MHCKHIYAILYKGLGVKWDTEQFTVPLVHQLAFTPKEIKRILEQPFDVVAMLGSASG